MHGVGVTKVPFANFAANNVSIPAKYLLDYLHPIYICQKSMQLSCGDTCQIWTWYSIANMHFDDAAKLGKITERR